MLLPVGMESYRVLISRKQLKDMGRSRFINGVEVTMFSLQMERAWRCAWAEQFLSSKIM